MFCILAQHRYQTVPLLSRHLKTCNSSNNICNLISNKSMWARKSSKDGFLDVVLKPYFQINPVVLVFRVLRSVYNEVFKYDTRHLSRPQIHFFICNFPRERSQKLQRVLVSTISNFRLTVFSNRRICILGLNQAIF